MRTRWKLSLVATVFLVALPITVDAAPGGEFWDDDGNVHEAQIEAIAAAGITFGCGPDSYCPEESVTRGQMAAFLVRAFDLPPSQLDLFTDDNDSIFESDIDALAAARITFGCGPERFCPDRSVTRGEMAAFLARVLHLPPGADRFVDDSDSQFEADINSLAEAGITVGCNPAESLYCPNDAVKRDQLASFLTRALGLSPLPVSERPSFTVAFSGDILLHMPVNYAAASYGRQTGMAYDFRPMFAAVSPIISAADLALCHLEVPVHPDSKNLSGYPTFQGPAEIADAIVAAGYEGCSVASNHSYDKGTTGVFNTLDVMTDRGLGYDGMAYDEADRLANQVYEVDGITVAHLSYADWLNGLSLPADKQWLVNLVDTDVILADAERAKASGADVVIVSLHWGSEYTVDPTAAQTRVGKVLTNASSIDLVVGHHAHVVQPIAQYGDEYVVYGLGNFLSNQLWSSQTTDGVIVTVDMALRREGDWVPRTVTYTPTWVQSGTYKILPVAATLNSTSISSTLRNQLLGSWQRTNERINRLDADVEASSLPQ